MANTFRPRIPNFIDRNCFEESYLASIEFNQFKEILSIPFMEDKRDSPNFIRFSKSEDLLMLELSDSYWVIGFFSNQEGLEDLPEWSKE